MSHELALPAPTSVPLPLFAPTPKAAKRVFEFFTTQINNDHFDEKRGGRDFKADDHHAAPMASRPPSFPRQA